MPPKKSEPSKKTEQKRKDKIVEDKTFGLKNKKGTKQQKYIKMVHQQVNQPGKSAKQMEKEKMDKLAKKEEKKKTQDELNVLFKPVEQKIAKGADPKSVLCIFFKSGQCSKGDKCKFSHDLNIGRKGEKKSIYADQRDEEVEDSMENWDEAKLEEVVNKKHADSEANKPKTAIICKYFIEAVETNKYGWFWNCPNGDTCIYRHALPPGFQLKKDAKKAEKEDEISLEDLIEKERAALSTKDLTKVTFETFLKWKERKRQEKVMKMNEVAEKKKADYKAGKMFGISGRELFEFNPDLVQGDDEEADDTAYEREDNDQDEENADNFREIDINTFNEESSSSPVENPSTNERLRPDDKLCNGAIPSPDPDEGKLDVAGALVDDSAADPADSAIDENLFAGEDLDIVEEELDKLDLVD